MDKNKRYTIRENWILRDDLSYRPSKSLFDTHTGKLLELSDALFALLKLFYFHYVSPTEIIIALKAMNINISIDTILSIESVLGVDIFTEEKGVNIAKREQCFNFVKGFSSDLSYLVPVSDAPLDIELHLTHSCNLKCLHCFQESLPRDRIIEQRLKRDEWKEVFRQIEQIGVQRVIISGGEPLFYPGFEVLAKSIFAHNTSFYLLTNGTLITDSLAEVLSQENVTNVSLDGRVPITHEILRGKHTFQSTINGINRLLKHNGKVIISHVIHQQNKDDLEFFIQFLIENGIKEATFGFVESLGRASVNDYLLLSQKEEIEYLQFFSELKKLYGNSIRLSFPSLALSTEDNHTESSLISCAAGTRRLAIAANGDIYPCVMAFGKKEFILGNVPCDSLLEAWRKDTLDYFRGGIKLEMIESCSQCGFSTQCSYKNCRLKYFSEERGLFAKPNNCFLDKMKSIDKNSFFEILSGVYE